jgi:hypothetical protein
MAIVDISEYKELARDNAGTLIAAGKEPSTVNQQVPVTGASLQSQPLLDTTRFVRVHTDTACRVEFGGSPVASASSKRMAAGQTEFFGVTPGMRVAVIQST